VNVVDDVDRLFDARPGVVDVSFRTLSDRSDVGPRQTSRASPHLMLTMTTDPTWTQRPWADPVSVTRKVPERQGWLGTATTLWISEGPGGIEGPTVTFGGGDEHADRQIGTRASVNVSHRRDIACDATDHTTPMSC